MGLFSKKDACPVCGQEVKGLFLVKIADKQTLCKDCSKQVSMTKELLKTATPDYIREHLDYRKKNAQDYASYHWDIEYKGVSYIKVGVALNERVLYIVHDDLRDEDNPVVFSFDQITGYELYRMTKKVDDADTPGETALESGLSVMTGITNLVGKGTTNPDYFRLKLTTTDPYWPEIDMRINILNLYGIGGCAKEMKTICQVFKSIVRKEPVSL